MALGIIVSVVFAIAINHCIDLSDWPKVIVNGMLTAISYIVFMFVLAFNNKERLLILSTLRKLCKW